MLLLAMGEALPRDILEHVSLSPRGREVVMVRRTIGFIITIAVVGWGFYQLAWHQDIVDDLGGIGFFGILVVFALIGGLLFWKVNRITQTLAIILGAVGAMVLDDVFDNITWPGVWKAALALLILFTLWVLVCADDRVFNGVRRWVLRVLPTPPANDD